MAGYLSKSFDPETVATTSDAASSALYAIANQSAAWEKGAAASSKIAAQSAAWEAGGHTAVTLESSADVLLGLSTQALSLDNQNANFILAGPTERGYIFTDDMLSVLSGDAGERFTIDITAVATPTFRAMVAADLGTTLTPTFAGIVIADAGTIGLGSGKGLIQFNDETVDTITFMNCNVGIGKPTPTNELEILGQLTIESNINVGGFALFGSLDNVAMGLTALGIGQAGVKLVSTAGGSGWGQGKFIVIRGSDSLPLTVWHVADAFITIGDIYPNESLCVAGNINISGVLKIDGTQVVSNRVVNAGIDDAIEAAFTALYPNASAVLAALQAGIQTHGLMAAT